MIVRVSNDGVAFRYHFPERDAREHKLVEESTGFAVPAGASAWIMPHQPVTKYGPAYESLFVEVPSGATAPTPSGWSFPALFKIAGGKAWLLITESGVDETNAASRLAAAPMDGQYRIRLPEAGEGNGVGEVEPASALPWTLPWRVLIVGDSPAAVVESTLVDDLAPPSVLKDTELDPSRTRLVELVVRRRQPEERDRAEVVRRSVRGNGVGVFAHRRELEPHGSGRPPAGPRLRP